MSTYNRKRDSVWISTVTVFWMKKILYYNKSYKVQLHCCYKHNKTYSDHGLSHSLNDWRERDEGKHTIYREMFIWLIVMNSPVQSSAAVVNCWVYTAGVLLHALWSSNNLSPNCFLSFDPQCTCCCVYRWNWSLRFCWGVEDWDAVPTAPHRFSSAV